MIKSFFVSSLLLLCVTIVESSFLSNFAILMVVPDLILICNVYFGLLNGKIYGEASGFVSGLFLDFIMGVPLGFNSLIRVIISYVAGIFADFAIIKGIILPAMSAGIATIIKRLLILAISFFFPKATLNPYGFISYQFLFEFIANIILAPFIFKFLSYFNRYIDIKDKKNQL